jgi:serine/threonine-protein kinase HipA
LVRIEPAIEGAAIQLPAGFPEGVAQAVFSGMRAQAKRLQEQPAS